MQLRLNNRLSDPSSNSCGSSLILFLQVRWKTAPAVATSQALHGMQTALISTKTYFCATHAYMYFSLLQNMELSRLCRTAVAVVLAGNLLVSLGLTAAAAPTESASGSGEPTTQVSVTISEEPIPLLTIEVPVQPCMCIPAATLYVLTMLTYSSEGTKLPDSLLLHGYACMSLQITVCENPSCDNKKKTACNN